MDIKIFDDVFNGLEKYLQEKSVYNPNLYEDVFFTEYPSVVLRETNNIDGSEINRKLGLEEQAILTYEIDIFTKDIGVDGKKVNRQTIARELQSIVDQYLGKGLGMKRTYCSPTPNIDKSVHRVLMRYTIKYNESRAYFY